MLKGKKLEIWCLIIFVILLIITKSDNRSKF
jgi:hypothetical protein